MKRDRLVGLRLSPIYDRDKVWMNDPVCFPLWKKAEQLGAVFNIFLAPHQLPQVGDMARRFPGVKLVIDHFAMIDITKPDGEMARVPELEQFCRERNLKMGCIADLVEYRRRRERLYLGQQ